MGDKEITIPLEEYKNFIKMQTRVELFAEHVNKEKYSISREECAAILGFELNETGEE